MRAATMAVAALALAGCFTPARQVIRQQSIASIQPSEREATFSRALQSVQRRGWMVAVSDRAAGLLTTQTMNTGTKPCGALTCESRGTLQITIADTGTVTVNLHREMFVDYLGVRKWFVPTAEQDVAAIESEQAEILAEIVPSATAGSH